MISVNTLHIHINLPFKQKIQLVKIKANHLLHKNIEIKANITSSIKAKLTYLLLYITFNIQLSNIQHIMLYSCCLPKENR